MKISFFLLKISAVLWAVWGIVHMLAGVLTISQDAAGAISGIADAADPELIKSLVYPAALEGILGQHGYNLFVAGFVATLSAFCIWKGKVKWIFIAAFVGGLFDIGYFIFIDLAGFAHFVPGTIMTLICGTAIALSLYVYFSDLRTR